MPRMANKGTDKGKVIKGKTTGRATTVNAPKQAKPVKKAAPGGRKMGGRASPMPQKKKGTKTAAKTVREGASNKRRAAPKARAQTAGSRTAKTVKGGRSTEAKTGRGVSAMPTRGQPTNVR